MNLKIRSKYNILKYLLYNKKKLRKIFIFISEQFKIDLLKLFSIFENRKNVYQNRIRPESLKIP